MAARGTRFPMWWDDESSRKAVICLSFALAAMAGYQSASSYSEPQARRREAFYAAYPSDHIHKVTTAYQKLASAPSFPNGSMAERAANQAVWRRTNEEIEKGFTPAELKCWKHYCEMSEITKNEFAGSFLAAFFSIPATMLLISLIQLTLRAGPSAVYAAGGQALALLSPKVGSLTYDFRKLHDDRLYLYAERAQELKGIGLTIWKIKFSFIYFIDTVSFFMERPRILLNLPDMEWCIRFINEFLRRFWPFR